MASSESLVDQADKAKQADRCICGEPKPKGKHFCPECWNSLSRIMRNSYDRLSGEDQIAEWWELAKEHILYETTRVRK